MIKKAMAHRDFFEERVYNRYLLSQIMKNLQLADNTLTQEQFLKRNCDDYDNEEVSAMWFGFKLGAGIK